ncbi:hypothetical protein IG631_05856 [Alternaria alternata]|nr:hypothetical protein IG631_05856 [Alternaria alternata]
MKACQQRSIGPATGIGRSKGFLATSIDDSILGGFFDDILSVLIVFLDGWVSDSSMSCNIAGLHILSGALDFPIGISGVEMMIFHVQVLVQVLGGSGATISPAIGCGCFLRCICMMVLTSF